MLLWIDLTKNRIRVLALRIPKRAQQRKKEILSEVGEERNFVELQWASHDIVWMLWREQFRKHFEHLKSGVSARQMRGAIRRLSEVSEKEKNSIRHTRESWAFRNQDTGKMGPWTLHAIDQNVVRNTILGE